MTHIAVWGVSDFASSLLAVATGALLYIACGFAAGAVIFAVVLGIRAGFRALRTVSEDDTYSGSYDDWDERDITAGGPSGSYSTPAGSWDTSQPL